MVPLSQSLNTVRDAINRFAEEVRRSQQLRSRLAYARAWYACPDGNGGWLYGPSKFIGYAGLTGDQYVELAEKRLLDGRKTEVQLKKWFKQVDPSTDRYEQLSSGLSAFLAEHGKAPSQKMRINIPKTLDNDSHASAPLVDLIVAVAGSLQPSELETLRRRLEAVGE